MANFVGILFKQDTIIKQLPVDSAQLPSDQRQKIPVGTLLVLQSFSDPAENNNHYKLALKNVEFNGSSMNWYVYAPHAQIIRQALKTVQTVSDVVSRQPEKDLVKVSVDRQTVTAPGGFLKLVFNVDTIIKRKPVDASVLNDQSKQTIPAGTELVLLSNKPDASNTVKLPIQDSHVKFTLKDIEFNGFSQDWYVFVKHVGIQRLG
jgi:hypothetical protein